MGSSFSSMGSTYLPVMYIDYSNGSSNNVDIGGQRTFYSMDDCKRNCDSIPTCTGFTTDNFQTMYWLKSSMIDPTGYTYSRLTYKKSPAYVALNNGNYNRNYVDNNIGNNTVLVGTPNDCANLCNNTTGCAGFVTDGANNISKCQLKSSMVLSGYENSSGVYTYGWQKQ
jgi:hypothetical protein